MELRENLMWPHEIIRLDGFTMIELLDDTPLGFRLAGVYLRDDWLGMKAILCHRGLSISPVIEAACALSQKHRVPITWIPRNMPIALVIMTSTRHRINDIMAKTQLAIHKYHTGTHFRHDDYATYLSFFLSQLEAFKNNLYVAPEEFIEQFPEREVLDHNSFRIAGATVEIEETDSKEGKGEREELVEMELITEELDQQLRSFALFTRVGKVICLFSHKGPTWDDPMQRVLQLAMDHHARIYWVDDSDNPIRASLRLIRPTQVIGTLLYSLSRNLIERSIVITPNNVQRLLIGREIMTVVETYERENLIPLKPEIN